jgi:hypothetical protein
MLTVNNGSPATYLGYFELKTNGVLTYTAGPSPIVLTPPVITAITRVKTTNTVFFTTISGGTYTLRFTNSTGLATPKTNWLQINSIAGTGSPLSLQHITTNSNAFYVITAQ